MLRLAAARPRRLPSTPVSARPPSPATPDVLRVIEAWFIAQGVPHFIGDYTASRFVLTRAAPLLVLYFVVTIVMTASFSYSLWLNALALGVALAVVFGGWAALNVARGRPWRSLPERVGLPEVLAFLLLPAIPPMVVGSQVSDALLTVVESAIFLVVVYLVTSYGLVAIVRWGAGRLAVQLGSLGRLLMRALPLLMVFIAFVFLQNETWQVAYSLSPAGVVAIVAFFLALSLAFLVGRLIPEVRQMAEGERSPAETLAIAQHTPAAPLCPILADATLHVAPMRWHEWVNVGAVLVLGQGLQIVVVTLLVQVALVGFGLLLVPVPLQENWAGGPVETMFSVEVAGLPITLTGELLIVALILGAFSGLYFTISALSDADYRAEFFSDADRELERVFAVRTLYRTALALDEPQDGADGVDALSGVAVSRAAGPSSTPSRRRP